MDNEKRFAVLIDADNVSEKYIKGILDEISNDGVATYKRIYGDWTKPNLGSWKNVLLENSITPIQQYSYTTGKNATDSALIIDAMDILYSGNVDGFCLVSSDSDFTRLASRLRESGILAQNVEEKTTASEDSASETLARADLATIKRVVLSILDEISDEDQWVFISEIGDILVKRYPDFDVRNYGFKKLTPFLKSLNIVDIRWTKGHDSNNRLVFVRAKQDKSAGK